MPKLTRTTQIAGLVLTGLVLCLPATASALLLDGETVHVEWQHDANPLLFEADVVVGAGVEIPGWPQSVSIPDLADIDLSDDSILITFVKSDKFIPATFNGLVFSDALASIPDITDVAIDPSSTAANFGFGRLSFSADSVSLNFQDMDFSLSETILLNLNPEPVPEPATGLLTAVGLLLLALRRSRA